MSWAILFITVVFDQSYDYKIKRLRCLENSYLKLSFFLLF